MRKRHRYRQMGGGGKDGGRKEERKKGKERRRKRSHGLQASVSCMGSPHCWSHCSARIAGSIQARVYTLEEEAHGGHLKAATSHPTDEETEHLRG